MSMPTPPGLKCPQCGSVVVAGPPGVPISCPQCRFQYTPQAAPAPMAMPSINLPGQPMATGMPGAMPGMSAPMAMPLPPHLRGQTGPAPGAFPTGTGPLPPHLMPKTDPAAAIGRSIQAGESTSISRAKSKKNNGLMLYGILGLLLLLAAGVFGAFLIVSGREDEVDPQLAQQPTGPPRVIHVEGESQLLSAKHTAVRKELKIKIESVVIGPVEFLNASGQPRFTDDKNYLTVNFRFTNGRDAPFKYLSWYDNVFDVNGVKQRPQLLNAAETEEYACLEPIEGARRVGWHSRTSIELPVNGYERDSVVFQITPEVAANPPAFHLRLPGGALGDAKWLRFEIPPDMIQSQ